MIGTQNFCMKSVEWNKQTNKREQTKKKKRKKERPYKSAHHKRLRNVTFQFRLGRLKIITLSTNKYTRPRIIHGICIERYEAHETIKKQQNKNKEKRRNTHTQPYARPKYNTKTTTKAAASSSSDNNDDDENKVKEISKDFSERKRDKLNCCRISEW